ncbi:MAG: aldo/keto reductase [Omnitrophica WOR_2 bacterium]
MISTGVQLDSTGLTLSPIGIGANHWGSHRQADPGLLPVFETALDLGITLFDTAEMYGMGGSERTLSYCIQKSGRRPIITTKFFPYPWRLDRSSLIRALKDSLKRLQLEQVDLYLVHWPFPPVSIETWMEAMAETVETGLARMVGVSNYNPEQMARAHAVLGRRGIPLACNQVEYNLLKRGPERSGLLDMCRVLNVTLVAYQPIAGGLLSGRYTPENLPPARRLHRYNAAYMARIQPLVRLIGNIGEAHGGKTPVQVAVNWLICKGALPIPGTTNLEHLREIAGSMDWRLNPAEIAALDAAGA